MEISQIVQQHKAIKPTGHSPVLERSHLSGLSHFCGMCHNSMTLKIVNLASDSVGYSHLSMLLFWVNDPENAAQENNISESIYFWMGLCTDKVHGRDFLPN